MSAAEAEQACFFTIGLLVSAPWGTVEPPVLFSASTRSARRLRQATGRAERGVKQLCRARSHSRLSVGIILMLFCVHVSNIFLKKTGSQGVSPSGTQSGALGSVALCSVSTSKPTP